MAFNIVYELRKHLVVGVKYCSTLLFHKFTKLFFPCFLTHLWMITVRKSKYDQLGTSRLFCFLGWSFSPLLISALKVRQESLERERMAKDMKQKGCCTWPCGKWLLGQPVT